MGFKADGRLVEVTTFRSEVYPDDTRRPEVVFLDDLAADLARRDFTINAIAMQGEQIIDLFGGQADIEARVIRAVGNPRERFKEDPLRMLRAARFASQLGFSVEPATTGAMERYAHRILHVARERWMAELDKLLVGQSVVYGLELLAATGLLALHAARARAAGRATTRTRPTTTARCSSTPSGVVAATEPDVTLRWGALLHDVAKPFVRAEKPGRSTYVKHDLLGVELVERMALYLKWSKARREDVRELVRDHLLETSPLREADMSAKPDRDTGVGSLPVLLEDHPQPVERQVHVDVGDRLAQQRHALGEPAGRDHRRLGAELDPRAAHESVDHRSLAEQQPRLHAHARVGADDGARRLEVDLRETRGLGEERLGGRLDTRSDGAAQIGALRVDDVDGGGGPEVDDDDRPAEPREGRHAVDDAVGADLVRVVVADRHAGLQPRPDDHHVAVARDLGEVLPRRGEPRNDRREDDVVHVAPRQPVEREEPGDLARAARQR